MERKKRLITKNYCLLGMFLLFSSLVKGQQNELQNKLFRILPGTWKQVSIPTQSFEKWVVVNDTLLRATSYTRLDSTEKIVENAWLTLIEGELWYQPQVMNQNDGKRIDFKAIESQMNPDSIHQLVVTFHNPNHDYPKYIRYLVGKENLTVSISNEASMVKARSFVFVKIPD